MSLGQNIVGIKLSVIGLLILSVLTAAVLSIAVLNVTKPKIRLLHHGMLCFSFLLFLESIRLNDRLDTG
jgi:hypothetical protein